MCIRDRVLAKQGVKVAVLDLNEAAAQKVVDEITACLLYTSTLRSDAYIKERFADFFCAHSRVYEYSAVVIAYVY